MKPRSQPTLPLDGLGEDGAGDPPREDDVDGAVAWFDVAVPVPVRRAFTYGARAPLAEVLSRGMRVAVPFAGRKVPGVILGGRPRRPEGVRRVHHVAGLIERDVLFPPELLAFLERAADYCMHPLGEVLKAAGPALPSEATRRLRAGGFLAGDEALPGVTVGAQRELWMERIPTAEPGRLGAAQRGLLDALVSGEPTALAGLRVTVKNVRAVAKALEAKGLVRLEEREVVRDPFFREVVPRDAPKAANPAQAVAIGALLGALESPQGGAFLLHGVTGSGKTEVYLQVIERARALERGALLLVPEIALTPQLVGRFRARFGDAIAVLHSGLTERERADAWRSLRDGRTALAIGARSALFAPVPRLGVLVVDEEHDPSFKQEEGFRYHARDMALLRAHLAGAVCVLGSATPSLETWHLAEEGRLTRLSLPERATPQALPTVEIVDLARHRSGPTQSPFLSAPLHRALRTCLEGGEQAILFLNRRGFAPSVRCDACGVIPECPVCSVTLTFHRHAGVLRCHYCDFGLRATAACAGCGATALRELGVGTEKLEDEIRRAFPEARVGRLDRDTAASSDATEAVLRRFRDRDLDVLVGTQMVTKGHDMPGVTVVGVVLADQSLAFPDFRAAERTFQLLSQVAGRAGRGEKPGHVIFQTYQPSHPAILAARDHDYVGFATHELTARRDPPYPPFSKLVSVRVDAGDQGESERAVALLAEVARQHAEVVRGHVQVLGPAAAPIERLRGRYRHRLLLRGAERRAVRAVALSVLERIEAGMAPARATVDVDPVSML